MKLTCPACGFAAGLEAYIADAEWREAVIASAAFPGDCGVPAVHYVGMFRPLKRGLTPDRAARLFRELNDMITKGVDFDRQRIEAPSHIWRQALLQVLDAPNIRRPLRNHHYLIRVVQGLLARRADEEQSARAERYRSRTRINADKLKGLGHVTRGRGGPVDDRTLDPDVKLPEGEAYQELYARAREDLEKEGVRKEFMSKYLIEARMADMLCEEEARNEGNQ